MKYHLTFVLLIFSALGSETALAGYGSEIPANASISQDGFPSAQTGVGALPSSAEAAYTTEEPPKSQQQELLSLDLSSSPPSSIYFYGQSMAWSGLSSGFPAINPAFWIATTRGWSWYATAPLGSWVQQLVYIPGTGTVKLYEIYPSGFTQMTSFGWASKGYMYVWFNADVLGRHISIITVSDQPSNAVIIDVQQTPLRPKPRPPGSIVVGDQFTKSVPANPSTGFTWEAVYDDSVINLVDSRFVSDSPG